MEEVERTNARNLQQVVSRLKIYLSPLSLVIKIII